MSGESWLAVKDSLTHQSNLGVWWEAWGLGRGGGGGGLLGSGPHYPF